MYVCMLYRTSLPPEAPDACAHARSVVLILAHLYDVIDGSSCDSGPGELKKACADWRLEGQTTRLEFSSNSCALQRRLHDAKAGDPAPYGSTGRVRCGP